MPVLKKGEIKVRATAYGTEVKSTGYVFYSYDKNSSALFFQFRNQNGEPTDIANAKIRLLLIKNDDEEKEFIPSQEDFEIISKPGGKAKFVLPEMLLAYQGKVTGYIYLDFDDGSQTDDGQFTFRIKNSMITHVLPEAGDKYVQDFEDVKERVEQAGDSATKDIEKSKDNAESQIGDYVGEVESAKDSTIEDIDKALPEVEDKLDGVAGKISEVDDQLSNQEISRINLLLDSDRNIKSSKYKTAIYYMSEKMKKTTYTLTIKGKLGKDKNVFSAYITNGIYDLVELKSKGNNIYQGTFEGRTDAENLKRLNVYAKPDTGTESEIEWAKLEKGNTATDWTPAPEDVVTKRELEKIKQAITNLGGSI